MDISFVRICLHYVPQKAVKGQVLADFLADHQNCFELEEKHEIGYITISPWKLWFDGSTTEFAAGIGFIIESQIGRAHV